MGGLVEQPGITCWRNNERVPLMFIRPRSSRNRIDRLPSLDAGYDIIQERYMVGLLNPGELVTAVELPHTNWLRCVETGYYLSRVDFPSGPRQNDGRPMNLVRIRTLNRDQIPLRRQRQQVG